MVEDGNEEGMSKEIDDPLWEVWAAEPLTKDAKLIVRWSRTSFFAGSPTAKPNIIDGKDFSLYHRCKDEAWARKRLVHARQYFEDVRLMLNGKRIEVVLSPIDPSRPVEDIMGECPKMGSLGGC
jgi:hypothetical protein